MSGQRRAAPALGNAETATSHRDEAPHQFTGPAGLPSLADAPPELWTAYAAGHADGTAETALLVDAAYRAGHHAGTLEAKRAADLDHQARPTDHRTIATFLDYLAQEPAATPRPIPPLSNERRRAS